MQCCTQVHPGILALLPLRLMLYSAHATWLCSYILTYGRGGGRFEAHSQG